MALILHPTETAQWQALLAKAQSHSGQSLNEDLESYLVFMLQRFVAKPEVSDALLAKDYLQSCQANGALRKLLLQEVGDKCLLFSGLFPEQAQRKQVSVTYFVELGQQAYNFLSDLHQHKTELAELYENLGEEFVKLMNLLHCIRELSGDGIELTPLQAEELWRKTGSQYALDILQEFTTGFPVIDNLVVNKLFH